MQYSQEERVSWFDQPLKSIQALNWETLFFGVILALSFISRFYDLESRVMSHDENSHVYYSWRLSNGDGFQHTPLTHGTLHFILTAFSFFIFGDNDFTARLPFALFSIATIGFVWFYRRYLGRVGALITAGLMLISPYMLYYGRYVRNEALVAFFGIVTLWAILRYLETGADKYTYLLTAVAVLHFTAKETAFIYTAQALIFLGLFFIFRTIRGAWKLPKYRVLFIVAIISAVFLLTIAVLSSGTAPEAMGNTNGETTSQEASKLLVYVPIILSGISLALALLFAILGLTWNHLKQDRAFGLMILLFTLVLPQLAPFPTRLVGWNPTDYSWDGIARSSVFIIPLTILSIAGGLLWNRRLWLINAAIFYVPFTILYTTFFTNGIGFFTGLIGSLGYWLEQQAVERGSQPWYYYLLLQIPFYEYLPALGTLLTLGIITNRKLIPKLQKSSAKKSLDSNQEQASINSSESLFLWLTGFWILSSLIAYTLAGEKMPWLTVHIALPMILFSGWGLGQLVEGINWRRFHTHHGWLFVLLLLVSFLSLASAIKWLTGKDPLFQGFELSQLNSSLSLILAFIIFLTSILLLIILGKKWPIKQIWLISLVAFFLLVGVLTGRTAYRAAYINFDYPTEYLVYAHSGSGVKEALSQIEELSLRITDGLEILVAYDDETTYPYWWYLRDYTNQKYYGASPTRELREAPIILVGDNNYAKIEPVVGQAYNQFDYIRIWWPNQDYYDLTWERVRSAINNPAMREALWQIWFNRDYSKYAELTGNATLTLPNWQPSDRMRLYVRKDIGAQVWNLGASSSLPEENFVDPYEGKSINLSATKILDGGGQFNLPRNLAVAQDGSLYIADTGNHRVIHMTTDGDELHSWGNFADSSQLEGGAPPGTFYEPWGIAVGPAGSVYVADTWNHRIQKFSSTGQFLDQWGYFGQAETGDAFWGPRDIAVDESGRIYVADTGNKRIVIFDLDGNYLTEFGGAGLLAGQFDEPVSLAVDDDGLIYVTDTWNQRVQVFRLDSQGMNNIPIKEWDIAGWYGQSMDNKPYIRVSREGSVFVSDPEGYRILEFTDQGDFIHFWGDYGSSPNSFILPTGMSLAFDGGLWIADTGNHRLLYFTIPEIDVEQ